MAECRIGLERFLDHPPDWARRARVGLLTHPPAVDRGFIPGYLGLAKFFGPRLKALFGPQHGFWGDKQDNMIESPDADHPLTGTPVYSLYGRVRKPEPEMLAGLDVLLVDLQDVGTRVYTYIHTLRLAMEACGRAGVEVHVLDRPNPLGRAMEGNLLDDDCRSFVGLTRLPMRHGLTMAELARFLADGRVECGLSLTPMTGYDPDGYFETTGLPWVPPSPNLPLVDSAVVYPGQVIFEGTNMSEGRGTTRPFETIGAPYINPFALIDRLAELDLPGVVFRPIYFEPTFNQHAGQTCGGVFLHVIDRAAYRPYLTALHLLAEVARLWPDEFRFSPPPYEYEFKRPPIDLIVGRAGLAQRLAQGEAPQTEALAWSDELAAYNTLVQPHFLY